MIGGGGHRAFDKRKCCMFHKACCIIGWAGWCDGAIGQLLAVRSRGA